MILHAPEFWKWFLGLGSIWIVERGYRFYNWRNGKGKTVIDEGIILPSNVSGLVIKRPEGFKFKAGDWVFICIPRREDISII